jgi:hypothetical protein
MARHVLIVRELPLSGPNRRQQYDAVLETGELIVTSHQPLLDGARQLLARGTIAPDDVLVLRHEGRETEGLSGQAGALAALTTSEPDSGQPRSLRFRRYQPHPGRGPVSPPVAFFSCPGPTSRVPPKLTGDWTASPPQDWPGWRPPRTGPRARSATAPAARIAGNRPRNRSAAARYRTLRAAILGASWAGPGGWLSLRL